MEGRGRGLGIISQPSCSMKSVISLYYQPCLSLSHLLSASHSLSLAHHAYPPMCERTVLYMAVCWKVGYGALLSWRI